MARHRDLLASVGLLAVLFFAGCTYGPSVSGTFDRSFDVTGPVRLELANAAGGVEIRGGSDGRVRVHGEARASGVGFDKPQKRLDETLANPPIEQKGNTIRIGKDLFRLRNLTISYTIQVPHDTDVSTNMASGAQTILGVRGPVRATAASGSIRVEKIDRDAQLTTASGSVNATDVGDNVRITSVSGSVNVADARGDVQISALAGTIQVRKPGGRVEADTASGGIDVQGATNDVKARAASGRVTVEGNPSASSYWDLKTASGGVNLSVPLDANFHLSADAVSGDIRTDIPIVVEEQGKHSLRAHVGSGGGRVEVRTASGEIRVSGSH
jgi:DUF4097 and DUF4098 domain-containing protein YvlB